MLYLILAFIAVLLVFTTLQVWGAVKARRLDAQEKKGVENMGFHSAEPEKSPTEGQTEGLDRSPTHGVSPIEANQHGWKE